jgi:hypothetical protein
MAEARARLRAFVDSFEAFWDGKRDVTDDVQPVPPPLHLLTWIPFQIAFSRVVHISGDEASQQEQYAQFVKKEIFGRGAPCPKARTWMQQKGRASADQLYAVTFFFAIWQGPTQSEPFCPSWPGHFPLPLDQPIQLDGSMNAAEQSRKKAVAMLHRAAQEMHDQYRHSTSGRHHCLRLLDQLKENLPVSQFVSSFDLDPHSQVTANHCVCSTATHFAYQQSGANLLVGTAAGLEPETSGLLLKYALERDRFLTEWVLDYGRHYTRWNTQF